MTNKDFIRLLLISYGFIRNIRINVYRGNGGVTGYEVSAENDDGLQYYDVGCEGLMFHVYQIEKFMLSNHVFPKIIDCSNVRTLLKDDTMDELFKNNPVNFNIGKTESKLFDLSYEGMMDAAGILETI